MNSISKFIKQPADNQTKTTDDGGIYVSGEALARLGGGDVHLGRKELRAFLSANRESQIFAGPTEYPKNVRVAGPSDEQDVLELLLGDLAENATHICPVDKEKILGHIQVGTRRRGGFVGVIGKPAVAAVILVPYQWWWSNGWYFQEIVNYVHPDHRKGTKHASDLIDFAKWAVDEQTRGFGYPVRLLCGVLGAWRIHSKVALYRRKAWQAGCAFIYPAPPMKGN